MQFGTQKYDRVGEMGIFLRKDNIRKLREGTENLINPTAIKEIQFIRNNPKTPGPDGFIDEF